MYFKRFQHGFISKAIAWSMVVALLVQPLGLSARNCGCQHAQIASPSVKALGHSTCCEEPLPVSGCCQVSPTKSDCCCEAGITNGSPCNCGDNCACVSESPEVPVPTPLPTESNTDNSTTIVASCSWPMSVYNQDASLTYAADRCHAEARTAQQTCILLSRFIC